MNTWLGERVMGQAKAIVARLLGINHAQIVPLAGTATVISTRVAVVQTQVGAQAAEVGVDPVVVQTQVGVRTTRGHEL